MRFLNLGILAHVDAGKTSLTERLLFTTGVIKTMGRVDTGTTQTDTLALERQRGITIKSAVVSFSIDDVTVNLIDTPGHPDFIAEVERVLSVLDGAILVISAVEGVQPQTRVLWRALQRLKIPTLIFVNKIDRRGADLVRVVQSIGTKLTPAGVAIGSVAELGTRDAFFRPTLADANQRDQLIEVLSAHNDALLAAYLDDETAISYPQLAAELAQQTQQALVHPIFFGSAITGAGIAELLPGLTTLLPTARGRPDARLAGTVFKIERGQAGEKIAYLRLFAGTLQVRDRVQFGREREGRVTALSVFNHGSDTRRMTVVAGQIAKLWGLVDVQIGDAVGEDASSGERHYFAPPTLETLIVPRRPADRRALHTALAQLAEQDPLINLRRDEVRQELFVSLYGEVQKEVVQATLQHDFQLDADFCETTTICVERPIAVGAAVEFMGQAPNPFAATVGLQIEPAPSNSGVTFQIAQEIYGTLLLAFFKAVEETVYETLKQGIYGWQVTDCRVTMTHSGYDSVGSTAADFRNLTPLVLMAALQHAATSVYEPMHHFWLELPIEALGQVSPVLARLRAQPEAPLMHEKGCVLEGDIPAAQVHELQLLLPTLTHGEGVFESTFDHYQRVHGSFPTRPRTDHNPLNRKEYLIHVLRRV